MKKSALFAALLALSASAFATDYVTVNGTHYQCSTRCDVTMDHDGYSVADCCGGTAFEIENPPTDP